MRLWLAQPQAALPPQAHSPLPRGPPPPPQAPQGPTHLLTKELLPEKMIRHWAPAQPHSPLELPRGPRALPVLTPSLPAELPLWVGVVRHHQRALVHAPYRPRRARPAAKL